ncbi:MAG: Crp/Fnr family transcriptional regulator [Candidatus Omnitrophica bacterium]|nr:Crp/Fnr family transcriptional regulator [Candidatus Omnitrophota bacterium]
MLNLAKIPLFRALPASERKQLGQACELRRFQKGQTIFDEGQPADSVWLIERGWVYLVKRAPQGTPVTIFTVTPEDVICGFSAAVGQSRYYASAIAATDTAAIRVPHTHFARLLRDQPGFAEKVLALYHTRMRHMADAISLAQAPVERRLAYVLLRLRATFGKTVPVTHQELSHMAGTRWETSIRTISSFKRKRWVATSRGKMTILNPQQLRALLRSVSGGYGIAGRNETASDH